MSAQRFRGMLPALVLIIALAAGTIPTRADAPYRAITAAIEPATIAEHIAALAVDIGARPAGSDAEAQAADYIAGQFEAWGYAVQRQSFEFGPGLALASQNVIARKPATAPGPDTRVIVAGAHMDSVSAGTGADDNASGVAALLAAAQALAALETRHDIVFVAFGAEEMGLSGSRAFVDALSADQRAAILVMFNVDTVGIGDHAYVYAGAIVAPDVVPGPVWARDLALAVAADLGHDLRTSPPRSWDGFTGPWSDHYPFAEHGIAVAYFERWNWDVGDPTWGAETAAGGDYLHTARDRFANVDPALVEPVAETLAASIALLASGQGHPSPDDVRRLR